MQYIIFMNLCQGLHFQMIPYTPLRENNVPSLVSDVCNVEEAFGGYLDTPSWWPLLNILYALTYNNKISQGSWTERDRDRFSSLVCVFANIIKYRTCSHCHFCQPVEMPVVWLVCDQTFPLVALLSFPVHFWICFDFKTFVYFMFAFLMLFFVFVFPKMFWSW